MEEDFGAARGIINGILFSIPLWGIILYVVSKIS